MDSLVVLDGRASHKVSPVSLPGSVLSGNHNNNVKTDSSLRSGISLDASALAKQSLGTNQNNYSNFKNNKTTDGALTGNGVLQNGPVIHPNSSKFLNETEINC